MFIYLSMEIRFDVIFSLSLSHIINENSTIRFIESYIELMKMKTPDFWEVRMFTMVHFSLGSGGQQ